MTQMLEYPVSDAARMPGNRRGLLVGFGVTAIVLGAVALLFAVGGTVSTWLFLSRNPGLNFSRQMIAQTVATGLFLLVTAAALAWGGVAMIRCRRWVAPLGWAVAVAWLVLGFLSIELMAADLLASHLTAQGLGMGMEAWFGLAMMVAVNVPLPLAFVIVLSRPGVRRTLEAYHPYPVWTDRYPPAALAVGTWCGVTGLLLLAGAAEMVQPFFGFYVHGWRATAVQAGWAALLLATAVACFRRPALGWRMAAAALTLYVVSAVLTHWVADPRQMYEGYGYNLPPTAMDGLVTHWRVTRVNETVMAALGWLGGMAYLVRTRRDFGAVPAAVREAAVEPATLPAVVETPEGR